jgi:hypothetical protein
MVGMKARRTITADEEKAVENLEFSIKMPTVTYVMGFIRVQPRDVVLQILHHHVSRVMDNEKPGMM